MTKQDANDLPPDPLSDIGEVSTDGAAGHLAAPSAQNPPNDAATGSPAAPPTPDPIETKEQSPNPGPSPSSLEATLPGTERLLARSGAIPFRRRKQQDREAGPSDKQIYVPPVTLPPNKDIGLVDAQKIQVAPSVLAASDERSRPTIRRMPSPLAQAAQNQAAQTAPLPGNAIDPRTVGGRTVRFPNPPALEPPPDTVRQPANQGVTDAKAADGASPWGADADAHINKEDLPSAQLRSSATVRPAPPMAQYKRRPSMAPRVAALALVAAGVAAGVWFLTASPSGKPASTAPIDVAPNPPPVPEPAVETPAKTPAEPPVPAEPPEATAAPDETAVPTEPSSPSVAVAPSPASTPQPRESRPAPPPPTRKPPPPSRPPPPATTTPAPPPATAAEKPPATEPTAPAPPTAEPPPQPTTTAPPRPF